MRRVPRGDAVPDLLVGDALFVTPAGVSFLQATQAAARTGGSSPFDYAIDLPVSASHIGIEQSRQLLAAHRAHPGPDGGRASGR